MERFAMMLNRKSIWKSFTLGCASLAIFGSSVSCSGLNHVAPNAIPAQTQGNPAVTPAREKRLTEADVEFWHSMIERLPKPDCAVATYPERQWRAVPCAKAPNVRHEPASAIRPATVGNGGGGDWSAQAIMGIQGDVAEGRFLRVITTGEHSNFYKIKNLYSLQLNTEPFMTMTCTKLGSPQPKKCQGWEQFLYSTSTLSASPGVSMQYWLLDFAPYGKCPPHCCPSKWKIAPIGSPPELDCYINSLQTDMPIVGVKRLGELTVFGFAAETGFKPTDEAEVYIADTYTFYSVNGINEFPDLYQKWQDAEFNVFGFGNGDEAVFNSGSTIIVRTEVDNFQYRDIEPNCYRQSFTGETNNLYLNPTPKKWPKSEYASIIFKESSTKTPKTSCVKEPPS